ncbi:Luciferin 4-monooxygenase [Operophtera brumata]|uniref:Luciferin 4-monooxygenase n=1 Tax=Operophtera brumata TaxID=104452 RepID=A0A0L7L6L8_OPEBR|nr:Luciferin 4-monooxygenase [Operophtera brumata]
MSNSKNYVYGKEVPAHLNFGKYILDRLRIKKDEIALEHIDTNEKLSYKEFTQYAVNLSASLTRLGVRRGDIVAVGSEKRNEFLPTALAILFTGATYTSYELKSGRAGLKHKLNITQPKFLICSKTYWTKHKDILQGFECIKQILTLDEPFDSIPSARNMVAENVDVELFEPETVLGQTDVAFILYSSGTTGLSKGVQLTHLNCILNRYGMTEAGELTSESWGHKGPKPGSVGKASPGITLKVSDLESRKTVGPNERGEICLKGPVLMKGYVGMNLSNYTDDEGFFRTELETLLQMHPGVKEASVVGQPIPVLGELPTAFIVRQPGFNVSEKELLDYIAEEVSLTKRFQDYLQTL